MQVAPQIVDLAQGGTNPQSYLMATVPGSSPAALSMASVQPQSASYSSSAPEVGSTSPPTTSYSTTPATTSESAAAQTAQSNAAAPASSFIQSPTTTQAATTTASPDATMASPDGTATPSDVATTTPAGPSVHARQEPGGPQNVQEAEQQTPATQSTRSSKHHGLSGGDIAGIVIGCVVGIALIAALGFVAIRALSGNRAGAISRPGTPTSLRS